MGELIINFIPTKSRDISIVYKVPTNFAIEEKNLIIEKVHNKEPIVIKEEQGTVDVIQHNFYKNRRIKITVRKI